MKSLINEKHAILYFYIETEAIIKANKIVERFNEREKLLLTYYDSIPELDKVKKLGKLIIDFEGKLDDTWDKLLKEYKVSNVYAIPKNVYYVACEKLAEEVCNIYEKVHKETINMGVNYPIVKMKLLFFAINQSFIGKHLERIRKE